MESTQTTTQTCDSPLLGTSKSSPSLCSGQTLSFPPASPGLGNQAPYTLTTLSLTPTTGRQTTEPSGGQTPSTLSPLTVSTGGHTMHTLPPVTLSTARHTMHTLTPITLSTARQTMYTLPPVTLSRAGQTMHTLPPFTLSTAGQTMHTLPPLTSLTVSTASQTDGGRTTSTIPTLPPLSPAGGQVTTSHLDTLSRPLSDYFSLPLSSLVHALQHQPTLQPHGQTPSLTSVPTHNPSTNMVPTVSQHRTPHSVPTHSVPRPRRSQVIPASGPSDSWSGVLPPIDIAPFVQDATTSAHS